MHHMCQCVRNPQLIVRSQRLRQNALTVAGGGRAPRPRRSPERRPSRGLALSGVDLAGHDGRAGLILPPVRGRDVKAAVAKLESSRTWSSAEGRASCSPAMTVDYLDCDTSNKHLIYFGCHYLEQ